MGRIICITGWFDIFKDGHPTGQKEFTVSHGIDEDTDKHVILPCEHPKTLGATYDDTIKEWVITN